MKVGAFLAVVLGALVLTVSAPIGATAGPSAAAARQCALDGKPVPCESLTGGGETACTIDGRPVSCDPSARGPVGGGNPRGGTPPRSSTPATVGATTTAPPTTVPGEAPPPSEMAPPPQAVDGEAKSLEVRSEGRNPAVIAMAVVLFLAAGSGVAVLLRRQYLLQR